MEVYREIFCLSKLSTRWHITHSPNHWSTEMTMLQYIEYIVEPYVRSVWELLYTPTTPSVIIMYNFKGQVTDKVKSILEKCHLYVCLLPANTTDLLHPMDVSVKKPAKSFLKKVVLRSRYKIKLRCQ